MLLWAIYEMEYSKLKSRHYAMVYRVENNLKGYENTTISEEWKDFEKFKEWYDEYGVEGWEVDKDILSETNSKCYSSETCLMVPREINALFRSSKSKYGKGVYYDERDNKYYAQMRIDGKTKNCGSSSTAEGAHKLYVEQRKTHLRELLKRYENIDNQNAYQRLVQAMQQYL
jgi:hypothetical protein